MQDLGTLGGDRSEATDVSTDGNVVVGWSINVNGNAQPFRWTPTEGMISLSISGGEWSEASAVSADGNTIILVTGNFNGNWQVFRWTPQNGLQNLGTLGGSGSWATDVSADGNVVIGWSYTVHGLVHAFRWTLQAGIQDLGTLSVTGKALTRSAPSRPVSFPALTPDPFENSATATLYQVESANVKAKAMFAQLQKNQDRLRSPKVLGGSWIGATHISSNGSIVVYQTMNILSQERIIWWTPSNSPIDLGTLGGCCSRFNGISAEGNVVVGRSIDTNGNLRAFRWTVHDGMQNLGASEEIWSEATDVSADGNVVVGNVHYWNSSRAFRWTLEEGRQDLGTLGGDWSQVTAISADGNVVVGRSNDANGNSHAFRWTPQDGMQDLGTLGGRWSEAKAVSADGSVVVGWSEDANGNQHAFRWTPQSGMQDLNEAFAELLTDGSVLYEANDVTPDGRYIVGYGYNATTGRSEAFLLDTGTPTAVEAPPGIEGFVVAYPNPFREQTTFTFTLKAPATVRLQVFDVLGREVARRTWTQLAVGEHRLVWKARDAHGQPLPPGVYVCRLELGDRVESRMLVHLR